MFHQGHTHRYIYRFLISFKKLFNLSGRDVYIYVPDLTKQNLKL